MKMKKIGKDYDWPVWQVEEWIAEGRTHAWIGEKLGVNPKLVYKVCKKHGIKCQRTGPRAAEGHPDWKGGRTIDKDGYVLIYSPEHPSVRRCGPTRKGRYVLEHRLVMEAHLGRILLRGEVVHHKNGNKQDNRIENLELFSKNSEHLQHELTGRVPNWTEDGKRRIEAGVNRSREIRLGLKSDAGENSQTPDQTLASPEPKEAPPVS